MRQLDGFHKHIDNGGVSIVIFTQVPEQPYDADQLDKLNQIFIETSASYFGYPSNSSTLSGYGQLTADDLQNIGVMFIRAANRHRELMEEYKKLEA